MNYSIILPSGIFGTFKLTKFLLFLFKKMRHREAGGELIVSYYLKRYFLKDLCYLIGTTHKSDFI